MQDPEEGLQPLFTLEIRLPKVSKKEIDRKNGFEKVLSLIEGKKEDMLVRLTSKKRRKEIILESDDFFFVISFGKTTQVNMVIHNPEKSIETANEVAKILINFMGTVLGEKAEGASVTSTIIAPSPDMTVNVTRKIIGEAKIAMINEKVERVVDPIMIGFTYETDGRKVFITSTFGDNYAINMSVSRITYEESLPFNLLSKEYEEAHESNRMIKMLEKVE